METISQNKNSYKKLHFSFNDIINENLYSDWASLSCNQVTDDSPKNAYNYNPNLCIPFLDESFEVIYIRDILERIQESRAKSFLSDCLRALKPNGIIRVAIKDLEGICKNYINELEKFRQSKAPSDIRYNFSKLELLDKLVMEKKGGKITKFVKDNFNKDEKYLVDRIGKESVESIKNTVIPETFINETAIPSTNSEIEYSLEKYLNLFDFFSIKEVLNEAGFVDISQKSYNESINNDIKACNFDSDENGNIKHPDEIFIEARKPNYIARNDIKVAFFNAYGHGGAANAALREHKAHRIIGLNSVCYTAHQKQCTQDCIYPLITKNTNVTIQGEREVVLDSFHKEMCSWFNEKENYPNSKDNGEFCFKSEDSVDFTKIPNVDDFDIVHFNWILGYVEPVIHPYYFKDKPIVWTLHDMNAFTGGCIYSGDCEKYKTECKNCPLICSNRDDDIANKFFKMRMQAYQHLDVHVVAPCEWMANCARQSKLFSRFPVSVIRYAQPLNIFRPLDKYNLREIFKIQKDEFLLLFTADKISSVRKGFVYLLEALKLLARTSIASKVVLFVIGEGAPDDIFKLGMKVNPLGYISSLEMMAIIYNCADALIVPSLEDNSPNTICESLGCGTPVIAFNSGGIPEMIIHKETGYVAKKGDVNDLLNGIMWASQVCGSMDTRIKCRNFASIYYSESGQAAAYEKLYKEILEKKNLQANKEKNNNLKIYEYDSETNNNQIINASNKYIQGLNNKCQMHIAVDARCFSYGSTVMRGIGHYAKNLLKAILTYYKDIKLTLYFDAGFEYSQLMKFFDSENVEYRYYNRNSKIEGDIFLILDPMSIIWGYDSALKIKVNIPLSVIMYDFTPINFKAYMDNWSEYDRNEYLGRMSDLKMLQPQILAISEYTKQDTIKQLGIPSEKIKVIMAGLNEAKSFQNYTDEEVENVLKKFNIKKPYFINVGGCDPHKNTEFSIASIIKLLLDYRRNNENIIPYFVLVGGLTDPYKRAYKNALASKGYDNFIFTDYVTQRELGCLYKEATALLYPSFFEGFGFPVLEAMANGTPVITSNTTSLPEVGGNAVIYINPTNQDEMVRAMDSIIKDKALQDKLKEEGIKQAMKFSWQKTAKKAVEAWQELIEKNSSKNEQKNSASIIEPQMFF